MWNIVFDNFRVELYDSIMEIVADASAFLAVVLNMCDIGRNLELKVVG